MPKLGAPTAPPTQAEKAVAAAVPKSGEGPVAQDADRKAAAVDAPAEGVKRAAKSKKPNLSATLEDEDQYVSVLYYGPYGTGKTTDVLSMARLPESEGTGKILLVNAEAGAKPTALRKHGIDPSRIVPWPPRGEVLTYAGMEQLFFAVAAELQDDPSSWLGGVWDSTTSIHDFLLTEVVEADLAQQQAIIARAAGKRPGNIVVRDKFLYEGDDYQRMQAQFKDLMRRFRYLPWHFAMTSLYRRDEDQKTHRVQYGPAVSPKLQNEIGGGPDIVIRTVTIEGKTGPVWYGRTFATVDEPAKDRFGMLPREMVNPTFDRIVAYIRGELTENTDPLQQLMPGVETTKRTPATKKSISQAQTTEPALPPAQDVSVGPETASVAAPKKRTPTRPSSRKAAVTPTPSEVVGSNEDPPF